MSSRFELKPLEERIAPSVLGILGGGGEGGGDSSSPDITSLGNRSVNPSVHDTGNVSVGDIDVGGIGNNLGAGNTIGNNIGHFSDIGNDVGQLTDVGHVSDVGHVTDLGNLDNVGHVTEGLNLDNLHTDVIDDVTSMLDASTQDS